MSTLFKKIALVARRNSPNIGEPLRRLAALLRQHDCASIVLDADTAAEHPIPDTLVVPPEQIGKVADLVIVLGGDGTMLSIARLVAPYRIPLVGINQGRLGFMTDVGVDDIETIIPRILDGDFVPEERMLLSAKVIRDEREVHAALAFNDVVFSRGSLGAMIEFGHHRRQLRGIERPVPVQNGDDGGLRRHDPGMDRRPVTRTGLVHHRRPVRTGHRGGVVGAVVVDHQRGVPVRDGRQHTR